MSYSITNVKADMAAGLHGTSLNQIANITGLFNRAARNLLADCDPSETMRYSAPVALHTGVYKYTAPTDLKGDRIFDIRPQVKRIDTIDVSLADAKTFDRAKASVLFGTLSSVRFDTGIKTLDISVNQLPVITVNSVDSISANGTWTGTVTGIATDVQNFVVGSGSVKFSATTGQYIEDSTMSATDLTSVSPEGSVYAWVWTDTAQPTMSVALRIGSSPTDYWTITATLNQDGTAFHAGWNLIAFPLLGAAATGAPVVSAIDYLRFTFTNPPAGILRIDGVTASLGTFFEVGYYSKYLFRDAVTGAFKEGVTSDSDLVNLDTDSYPLFFDMCMVLACQQKQGEAAMQADLPFYQKSYEEQVRKYQFRYPSQALKLQTVYYPFRKRGYRTFLSRRV